MGKLFVLMGKSASGKDAVYRNLLADEALGLKKIVIYTTRPMRLGEENGKQYHFVTEDDYRAHKRDGRIIEERGYETQLGLWRYYTADDGQIDANAENDYLMIATPEAFVAIRAYYGEDRVIPVLISSDDGIRLERALKRERRQEQPRYDELCRRFLADDRDFAADKLKEAGIKRIFTNDDTLEACLDEVKAFIRDGHQG